MCRARVRILPLIALLALTATALPAAAACRPAPLLARQVLDEEAGGALALEARFGLDIAALEAGRAVAMVDIRLPAAIFEQVGPVAELCLAIVVDTGDELEVAYDQQLTAAGLDGAAGLRYGVELALDEEALGLVVVIEAPGAGLWGGVAVEQSEDPLPPPGPEAVTVPGPASSRAWYEVMRKPTVTITAGGVGPDLGARGKTVLRLVPPRRQPAAGDTRIWALASSPAVDRVEFYLDGERVAERGRKPFVASVPLASPARPQRLRAVAFDRNGHEMGDDTLTLNEVDAPFRVRIAEVEGDPGSGGVTVAAEVTVPLDAELAEVELFHNETSLGRLEGPPYRARVPLPGGAGPTDFVRVAAALADGATIDDVALLLSPGLSEEVEVNLVTVHALVTGEDGRPLADLPGDAFRVHSGKRAMAVESFSYADDVPLLLGLVIDTSNSMSLVMDDTRRAASRFLQTTVRDGDRGFLVDFDRQPRLLRDTTGDVVTLLGGLGSLEAKGRTALYDAVIFAMVQFERQGGRKALVVLTDGADLDSRFGPRDCIEYGQRLGVAIYMLALDNRWGGKIPEKELARIADATGGALFRADGIENLGPTYDRINAELRSQYTLTFYSERELSADERRAVKVEVEDARVRTIVDPVDPGSGGTTAEP